MAAVARAEWGRDGIDDPACRADRRACHATEKPTNRTSDPAACRGPLGRPGGRRILGQCRARDEADKKGH